MSNASIEGSWRSEWPSDLTTKISMQDGCRIKAGEICELVPIDGYYDPGNDRYPYTVIRVKYRSAHITFYGNFYVINSHEMFSHVSTKQAELRTWGRPLQEVNMVQSNSILYLNLLYGALEG